jgi:uncharacterized membrane protein YgdD (TMEM256/DUF423 family)
MNDPSPATGFSPVTLTAILTAALAGLSGVVLGAYAAHGAPAELREGLSVAALYALIHGLALIAAALVHERAAGACAARWLLRISMLAFALGIALFSGGIFFRAGTAALGGTLLIGGWLGLALGSGALLFTAGKR